MFSGNWENSKRKGIIGDFNLADNALDGFDVVFAHYEYEDYSGNAIVILLETSSGALFEANGSHCSCHGLEGQWELEKTSPESILHRIDNGQIVGLSGRADAKGAILSMIQRQDLDSSVSPASGVGRKPAPI